MQIQPNTGSSHEPVLTPVRTGATVFCPECGAAVRGTAKFCSSCGQQMKPPPGPPLMKPVQTAQQSVVDAEEPTEEAGDISKPVPRNAPIVKPASPLPTSCHCGHLLPRDAEYCPRCGVWIGEVPVTYRLVQVTAQGKTAGVDITDDEVTIGKDAGNHVVLDQDDYLSRRHARVTKSNGMFFIEDLGSSNGTLLRVRRPLALELGDEIVVGTTVLRFEEAR